jgi:hypothetical protein
MLGRENVPGLKRSIVLAIVFRPAWCCRTRARPMKRLSPART